MPHSGSQSGSGSPRDAFLSVAVCSEFLLTAFNRDPELPGTLFAEGFVERPRKPGLLTSALRATATGVEDEAAMMSLLRRWRQRELARIAWRDLAGWSTVEESLRDLTELADAAIGCAVDFACTALTQRYGTPRAGDTEDGGEGAPQTLVTLGMGKLGGGELNFSSDIDLIFLFPQAGNTDGRRSISNEEFFTRQARQVIRLLDAVTEEGFVFRVDMRLRPFGDSGPLAASFAFFEGYLQQQGRDWERYAYIKARAVTGAETFAQVYRDVLRPFVYRRYLDFGVFEALREMKAMIAREVEQRELQDNIKLGPGGIREIEFIVQAFQLLRGGGDARLQSQSLLRVLPLLSGEKLLPAKAVAELRAAYLFLRRLENRLQMFNDEQTHDLPEDPAVQARLVQAWSGRESAEEDRGEGQGADAGTAVLPDWKRLVAVLEGHRAAVTRRFNAVLFGPEREAPLMDMAALWDPQRALPALQEAIAAQGLTEPEALAALLAQWRDSQFVQRLDDIGRRRLQVLMPAILAALKGVQQEETVLRRVLTVLEALGRRSAYLALLNENPEALGRLVQICARSDLLARQIAAFPLVLDELVDRRIFEQLPTREQFVDELAVRRRHTPEADPEREVEALRAFQRAATFRVALADLTDRMPLMQVSDRLTDIAELIVEEALQLAWAQMTQLYGAPMCGDESALRPAQVAVIAYGKLGARELGYSSDLDLVFVHDSAGEAQHTDGIRAVDNAMFFLRLGQRIVHLLTMHSAAGRLYEVDMRLRPSGKGGMMVTQVAAFADYQRTEAWTWEHQALLRARAIAGEQALRRRFEDIRLEVLCGHVRLDTLRAEVCRMRERMRAELSKSREGQFDVKQDPGGIADIEFLAQYWALIWARRYPPLVMYADTIRQLESVASANLVSQQTIDVLAAIYREYRAEIHHRTLEGKPAVVQQGERFAAQRRQVSAIWAAAMQ
jgi:glutamate-ammonia-ligase adenylyltransferase